MAEKGKIMLDFAIIESFLSFDTVLSNSDYNQRKQLAQVTKVYWITNCKTMINSAYYH